MSLLVITHQDSYKYAFKTFPFQHVAIVFTARRYAKAQSLLSPAVRLSVTFVYCIQMAENIVKLLSRHGSTIILKFFCLQAPVPNSIGNPYSGGGGGYGKYLRFSTEITGTRQAHGCYATLIGSHRSIRVSSDDLEWPWKAGHEGQIFQADLLNNARTVWPRTTNDRIKRGERCISRGHRHPYRKGAGPKRFPILGVPFYLCTHPLTQNYQIWRGDTYGEGVF